MNKTDILKASGITIAIVAGSTLAVTAANAHRGGFSEEDKTARIAEFAERFELEEAEVQSYFDEKKADRRTEREERRSEYVAGLVEAGTLTQEQADELKELRNNFKSEIEALKESGADRETIKATMQENRTEVEAWAEAQGINLDDIRPEKGEKQKQKGPRFLGRN